MSRRRRSPESPGGRAARTPGRSSPGGVVDPYIAVRKVADRAIRRLGILEVLILAGAALAALVGGALAAFLAASGFGWPFRPTWLVASLLFFVVPGLVAWSRSARNSRKNQPASK